ncbi:MAG TPA: polyprenyl synthetase family protein [Pseudonocardiaceae bacterium]
MSADPVTESPPTPVRDHPRHAGVDDDLPRRVQQVLVDYLEQRRESVAAVAPAFATEVVDTLTAFVLRGGKRLRPMFAWWGWRAGGGDPGGVEADAVLRAVSALELLQAFALVHDDVMDGSDVRRGAPAMHVVHARRHRTAGWEGDPERFGSSVAVLAGDLALTWADDLLTGAGLPAVALCRAQEPWSALRAEMLAGQYLDLRAPVAGQFGAGQALRIARLKCAAYTVERPLHLGAAIAGAPAPVVAALRRYGVALGVAFQLRDDLLGVFGDPEVTGKPAGEDLREGKCTLLVVEALRRAAAHGPERVATLRELLGRADLDAAGVARARRLLVELGAVRAVERRIERLADHALRALEQVPIDAQATARLSTLVRTVVHRDR